MPLDIPPLACINITMATMSSTQVPGAAAPQSGGILKWIFFGLVALGAVVFYFAAAFRYFNYSEATYGELRPLEMKQR